MSVMRKKQENVGNTYTVLTGGLQEGKKHYKKLCVE